MPEEMGQFLLNICYPTFNRGNRFYEDINELLTCRDTRFCISIQDNKSTDGSYGKLESIDDDRLFLRQNPSNLGSIGNFKACLNTQSDADYLLFCLDKDYIRPDQLSLFLDYLEKYKPSFGYLDPYNNSFRATIKNPAGIESIKRIAYYSRHPSGFFWKKELFEVQKSEKYFAELPADFDFIFDVIAAHLAVDYSGELVFIPLFMQWESRPEYSHPSSKTLSYNEDNIYFSTSSRFARFEFYVRDLLTLSLTAKDFFNISEWLLDVCAYDVTVGLRKKYGDRNVCEHYNIASRAVRPGEMINNIHNLTILYKHLMGGMYSKTQLLLCTSRVYVLTIMRIFKSYIVG
jgi:glycosyltransferase involved in cell wall biosynthesis